MSRRGSFNNAGHAQDCLVSGIEVVGQARGEVLETYDGPMPKLSLYRIVTGGQAGADQGAFVEPDVAPAGWTLR